MYHGESAKIEDYPYLVFIGNDISICGGAIVSRYNVLTAAHCVQGINTETHTVRAGSSFRNEGGSVHHIESVAVHEKFDVDMFRIQSTFDLAVIRVKEPFDYDETRQPIPLFESGEQAKPLTRAKGAGWGRAENGEFPKQFKKLDFFIVDNDYCNETVKAWPLSGDGISEGQFCAITRKSEKHMCHGDSGTPLAVGDKMVGITIYGGTCEIYHSPGVYTEVAYFRDWIDQHVTYDEPENELVKMEVKSSER